MKYAVISSLTKPTNINTAGGQEVWTSRFLLELIKKDNIVDLYALDKSINLINKITLIKVVEKGLNEIKNSLFSYGSEYEKDLSRYLSYAYARATLMIKKVENKYDIILDNSCNHIISTNADKFNKPLVVTCHFPSEKRYISFFKFLKYPNNLFFIFSSKYEFNKTIQIPKMNKYYIPHGINVDEFDFINSGGNSILWYGRIDPALPKGLIEALKVSKIINKRLNIFAFIENQEYFNNKIKPLFSDLTKLNIINNKRNTFFQNIRVFLFPVQKEELFGLTMLEAMATGTPVVAFARNSSPEIIKDGETGLLVNPSESEKWGSFIIKKTGIEGLCEAVERIYAMPEEQYKQMRLACRAHVEKNFTVKLMVTHYEAIYQKIFENKK